MYLSLSQAAKETGKSKGTISKYLSNGKLSYISKDDKGYKIDPSELFRVFPKEQKETPLNEQTRAHKKPQENSEMNPEVNFLHERIKDKDKIIDDLREERNDWKKQAQTLLLQSPQKAMEGNENIYSRDVGENKNKASAGHVWVIIALFLIVICTASMFGYFYFELKPQLLPESQVTIQNSPKKSSETPVFTPQTPLNFTPLPNN
jgi:transcriptional regulator with XRE-family HTH domain